MEVAASFLMPDELWLRIHPLLPPEKHPKTRGRPPVSFRAVMDGIFYVLRTGCHWKAVPRSLGSGSTVHRRFQQWQKLGIFFLLYTQVAQDYDDALGIDWRFPSMEGVSCSP